MIGQCLICRRWPLSGLPQGGLLCEGEKALTGFIRLQPEVNFSSWTAACHWLRRPAAPARCSASPFPSNRPPEFESASQGRPNPGAARAFGAAPPSRPAHQPITSPAGFENVGAERRGGLPHPGAWAWLTLAALSRQWDLAGGAGGGASAELRPRAYYRLGAGAVLAPSDSLAGQLRA